MEKTENNLDNLSHLLLQVYSDTDNDAPGQDTFITTTENLQSISMGTKMLVDSKRRA